MITEFESTTNFSHGTVGEALGRVLLEVSQRLARELSVFSPSALKDVLARVRNAPAGLTEEDALETLSALLLHRATRFLHPPPEREPPRGSPPPGRLPAKERKGAARQHPRRRKVKVEPSWMRFPDRGNLEATLMPLDSLLKDCLEIPMARGTRRAVLTVRRAIQEAWGEREAMGPP